VWSSGSRCFIFSGDAGFISRPGNRVPWKAVRALLSPFRPVLPNCHKFSQNSILPHRFQFMGQSYSQKPQETLNLLVTEERYWALFYMPLHKLVHNVIIVLVQIANKMGLQKIGQSRARPAQHAELLTPSLYILSVCGYEVAEMSSWFINLGGLLWTRQ
jgi:hypothetical protein